MTCDHDYLFPVSAWAREIAARWDSLKTGVPFAALHAHVHSRQPSPQDCAAYLPSFCLPENSLTRWDRYAKVAKRQQVQALETATAHCVAARAMVPKPLAGLLAGADAACRAFDRLRVAEEQAIKDRHHHRVKGGEARQERLRPVREYAFRLFRSMCPDEGWESAAHAARAIYPQVKEFVRTSRLPMLAEDSLIRTIRGWLKKAFYKQS